MRPPSLGMKRDPTARAPSAHVHRAALQRVRRAAAGRTRSPERTSSRWRLRGTRAARRRRCWPPRRVAPVDEHAQQRVGARDAAGVYRDRPLAIGGPVLLLLLLLLLLLPSSFGRRIRALRVASSNRIRHPRDADELRSSAASVRTPTHTLTPVSRIARLFHPCRALGWLHRRSFGLTRVSSDLCANP